ncbi:MAG: SDR family oxidoreductase [Anaerolineae bacterium]|nr:SDR family oxidoreductase [Anaerolineae bacterium]
MNNQGITSEPEQLNNKVSSQKRLSIAALRKAVSTAAGRPMVLSCINDPVCQKLLADSNLLKSFEIPNLSRATYERYGFLALTGRDVQASAAALPGLTLEGPLTDFALRLILAKELGICCAGENAAEARRYFEKGIAALSDPLTSKYQSEPAAARLTQADTESGFQKGGLFKGEVALVTGAASGIGKAAVRSLLNRGASVVGLDINPDIKNTFDDPEYLGLVCDLSKEQAILKAIDQAVETFGGLDMLVLNAGIFPASCKIENLQLDEWHKAFTLNLDANLVLLREAYPLFKLSPRHGRVAVNSSRNVPAPGPGAATYSASKAALTQLARVAALEWGNDHINVNMVNPHAVFDTGLWTEDVLKTRAANYHMSIEQYKTNNVLHVELTSHDIGEMLAEMCGPLFEKITGAQVPMDGGSERVI